MEDIESKVSKIASLVKERDGILKNIDKLDDTKEWTEITIKGEDGAEHSNSFSFGGVSCNDTDNNNLAKEIHSIVSKNFNERLDKINLQINKLIK